MAADNATAALPSAVPPTPLPSAVPPTPLPSAVPPPHGMMPSSGQTSSLSLDPTGDGLSAPPPPSLTTPQAACVQDLTADGLPAPPAPPVTPPGPPQPAIVQISLDPVDLTADGPPAPPPPPPSLTTPLPACVQDLTADGLPAPPALPVTPPGPPQPATVQISLVHVDLTADGPPVPPCPTVTLLEAAAVGQTSSIPADLGADDPPAPPVPPHAVSKDLPKLRDVKDFLKKESTKKCDLKVTRKLLDNFEETVANEGGPSSYKEKLDEDSSLLKELKGRPASLLKALVDAQAKLLCFCSGLVQMRASKRWDEQASMDLHRAVVTCCDGQYEMALRAPGLTKVFDALKGGHPSFTIEIVRARVKFMMDNVHYRKLIVKDVLEASNKDPEVASTSTSLHDDAIMDVLRNVAITLGRDLTMSQCLDLCPVSEIADKLFFGGGIDVTQDFVRERIAHLVNLDVGNVDVDKDDPLTDDAYTVGSGSELDIEDEP